MHRITFTELILRGGGFTLDLLVGGTNFTQLDMRLIKIASTHITPAFISAESNYFNTPYLLTFRENLLMPT